MLALLADTTADTVAVPTPVVIGVLVLIGAGCLTFLLIVILNYIRGVKESQKETQQDVRQIRDWVLQIAQNTGTPIPLPLHTDELSPAVHARDSWGGLGIMRRERVPSERRA
jgi:hypothetical protein